MEKISVIMPVYNIENYLTRALECLINQTFKDLEIILIDDGSTDESGKICDKYQKKDSRFKVIHQKNSGVSVARNVGLKAATGKYIGFVDSDDVISLEMYEVLYRNIKSILADVSVCNYQSFSEAVPTLINNDNRLVCYTGNEVIKDLISDGKITNFLWNKLFKKELFNEIIFPEGKIYEDMYVLPKIFEKAKKVCYTESKLYGYYQRSNSYVNNYTMIKNENYLDFCNEIYNYLLKYHDLYHELEIYRCFSIYSAFLQAAKSRSKEIITSKRMQVELKKFRKYFKINSKFELKRKLLYYLLFFNKMLFYRVITLIK